MWLLLPSSAIINLNVFLLLEKGSFHLLKGVLILHCRLIPALEKSYKVPTSIY